MNDETQRAIREHINETDGGDSDTPKYVLQIKSASTEMLGRLKAAILDALDESDA